MVHDRAIDRRRLLQLAASAATGLWLPRAARSQPRLPANPFALGVASGSPSHDSVVLWTRLVAPGIFESLGTGAIPVRWELAHDEQFSRIVQRGQSAALFELAHSVHVEVAGLEPDRWYFYRFIAGDAVSPTGRTRTFPAPDAIVQQLRLGLASCQRWEHGYYSAYRHMRSENLDAVLFVGDYIYEYPIASNPVRVPTGGWVVTLDDYRRRYALHKSDTDLQAMHAACPWLQTWDDHEVQNDYAGLAPGLQRTCIAARHPGRLPRAARRRLPGVLRTHAAACVGADPRRGGPGCRCRNAHLFATAHRPARDALSARRPPVPRPPGLHAGRQVRCRAM